jgi:hypothetical protein
MSWIWTSFSIFITTIGMLLFFAIHEDFYDISLISLLFAVVGLSIYACYFFEMKLKL